MDIRKISVLMPVYNAQKYIKVAVESILNQTFTDFEFIIINDGSSDESLKIIEGYALQDARIKVINRENKGLIKTLNEGLKLAKGKYIARMDADDISLPLRFEKQIQYLEEHSDCIAVGTLAKLIDSDGDVIGPMGSLTAHSEIDNAHLNGKGGAIVHPSAMFRTDEVLSEGGYLEGFMHAEDLELWLRLAEVGKLANIPETLFLYRQHLDSIGYTKRLSQFGSAKKAVFEACKRRDVDFSSSAFYDETMITPELIDIYIKWGWWALNGRNIATARKYARKALLISPFNGQVWKLMACCIRGY